MPRPGVIHIPPASEPSDSPVPSTCCEGLREDLGALVRACHDELCSRFDQRLEEARESIIADFRRHELAMGKQWEELPVRLDERLTETEAKLHERIDGFRPFPLRPLAGASSDSLCSGHTGHSMMKEGLHEEVLQLSPEEENQILEMEQSEVVDLEEHDKHRQHRATLVHQQQRGARQSVTSNSNTRKDFVNHPYFEAFFATAILTNALFIGVQTDVAATHGEDHYAVLFYSIGLVYTVIFTVELAVRVYCQGWSFFIGRTQWQWNYLDLVIVAVSILEACLDAMYKSSSSEETGQSGHGATQFRILRVLRVTRLVRAIRLTRVVRFIRALRMLVFQIISTVKHLIWALLLFMIMIYLSAIVFTQAATQYLSSSAPEMADAIAVQQKEALIEYWSTLPRSMFTLFKAITNGMSWEVAVLPLSDLSPLWVFFFVAYICFMQFAVLNVLTGVFCQNAIDSASHDEELVTQSILAQRQMYIDQTHQIFGKIDLDGSGFVTIEEFKEGLGTDTMRAYLDSLGLDVSDIWTLFKLMDKDGGDTIDLDEFTIGCLRLKGNAKGLDMAKLEYEHRWMAKRLAKFIKRTDEALGLLTGKPVLHADSYRSFSGA